MTLKFPKVIIIFGTDDIYRRDKTYWFPIFKNASKTAEIISKSMFTLQLKQNSVSNNLLLFYHLHILCQNLLLLVERDDAPLGPRRADGCRSHQPGE